MNNKELFKAMFHAFFIIVTGATVSMYICCILFSPDAIFSLSDIGGILLAALVSDLSFFVFYSKKELNRRQTLIRFFIHIPAVVIILLIFSYLYNWVDMKSPIQVIVFILLVLGVYVGVFAIAFFRDKQTAARLNNSLKKRYHSQ